MTTTTTVNVCINLSSQKTQVATSVCRAPVVVHATGSHGFNTNILSCRVVVVATTRVQNKKSMPPLKGLISLCLAQPRRPNQQWSCSKIWDDTADPTCRQRADILDAPPPTPSPPNSFKSGEKKKPMEHGCRRYLKKGWVSTKSQFGAYYLLAFAMMSEK